MKSMRARAALALVLLLAAQCLTFSVQAAPTVYFTAVNDNMQELTDATMPFWSGGSLYVPSTVVTGTGGEQLGIRHSRYVNRQTVILYTSDTHALIFDLSDGTTKDNQGNVYAQPPLQRGDVVFVPLAVLTSFFGLTYSRIQVSHGYLVRIRNDKAVLSDSMFAEAAGGWMEELYSGYIKSNSSSGSDTPSVQPSTEPSAGKKSIYLCIRAGDPVLLEETLDTMERYSAQGAFFCPAEFLEEQGDLVRRMLAAGHTVGLIADGASQRPLEEQLEEGNSLLYRVSCSKTRLVWLENASDALRSRARAAGYCCLSPDLDRSAYGLVGTGDAQTLMTRVSARSGDVTVWLADNLAAYGLRAFLQDVTAAGDRCLALTETVA